MSNWIWIRLLLGVSGRYNRHCGTVAPGSLGTEQLEQRMLLSVTSGSESRGTEILHTAPTPVSMEMSMYMTEQVVSPLPAISTVPVTWGQGLSDPEQPSAWDITGMPVGEFHSQLNFVKRDTIDPLLAPGNPRLLACS